MDGFHTDSKYSLIMRSLNEDSNDVFLRESTKNSDEKKELIKNENCLKATKCFTCRLRHRKRFYEFIRYHSFKKYRAYYFKRKCKHKSNVMNKSTLDKRSTSTKARMLRDTSTTAKKLKDDKFDVKNIAKIKFTNKSSYFYSSHKSAYKLDQPEKATANHIERSLIENDFSSQIKQSTSGERLLCRDFINEIPSVNQTNKFTVRCLLMFFIQLLIGQLLLNNSKVLALDNTCLEHCTCIYSKNKFIADCSALALDNLPVVKDELATRVQILNLTRNAFIKLENEMFFSAKMINLQRIYLSKGALQYIGNTTFYKLTNLVELDLSQNRLTIVPKDSFHSISKLIILDLSSNQIQVISEFSFHPLKMLKVLSLENNQISVIDPKAFLGLADLETLKLSDNQISYLASESISPLNKLHTLTLASNRWLCDCKMRQLKEFLLHNRRINVLDQPICDNQPHNIWTEISIDSFLCTPKLISNNSDRVYQVGQGSNLALECSFQVESTLDSQPAVIRWLWQNRPITNNSEGVVSSQRFVITEYDYYLTTETTSTPYIHSSTPSSSRNQSSSKHTKPNFKFPVSNQLDIEDEDGLPLIELHDLNQFHRSAETNAATTSNNQPAKTIDPDQRNETTQRSASSSSTATHPSLTHQQQHHHSHSVPPFERHIVKRRIRKSRMEITFILELNQGEYWCEASNQAGSVALNFTIYVNSVIRRTDFLANNRASSSPTTTDSASSSPSNDNNVVNKRSGIASSSDDALFNELNAADQASPGQTKHQPLLNTSNSVVVGLVLGILFGILLVLAVFSLLIVALCKKKLTDQVDLMPSTVGVANSGQNSSTSTGCSTENSLISTLAQVNCLQANNLQACSFGGHPALSASGASTNDWYTTFANNFGTNNNHANNSATNTLNNLLASNRGAGNHQNNYSSPLSIAAVHHSDTMSQFNSANSLSMLNSSNNLYGHCNLLAGHDQLLTGHHMAPHQLHSHHLLGGGQTGGINADHCGTLDVMNLESAHLEKSDLNSNALQIYDEEDDLKKTKIA